MIFFFRLITMLAFIIAFVWLCVDPKFDSAFATAIALASVIALFVTSKKMRSSPSQSQVVANHSSGIQAGGDVNIGSFSANTKANDAE
jgi:hypothetical protein